MAQRWFRISVFIVLIIILGLPAFSAREIKVIGHHLIIDGKSMPIIYRGCGDLDGDSKIETVFSAISDQWSMCTLFVAKHIGGKWLLITSDNMGMKLRTDVTDVNGDKKSEIVARSLSGDGHWFCNIYTLRNGRLVKLGKFSDTKLRDLTGDGIPEILSTEPLSFMFEGDHWLTIWKWNGCGYTDISHRFPRMYNQVIRDMKRTIQEMRFTKAYGEKLTPKNNPEALGDIYYYLGKAYEYRGILSKARMQYAIAYRLNPKDEAISSAFNRAWNITTHRRNIPSPYPILH